MRSRWMTFAVAMVLVGATGCGVSFQELPLGRSPEGESYRMTMVFDNASNLPVGGKVMLGQSVVGRISSLRAQGFQAHVDVSVREDVQLPVGTRAEIQLASVLGEEHIDLRVPDGAVTDFLADGAMVGVADTAAGPTVEDLLSAVGTMLGGSGLDQARTIVQETNTALAGREQSVRDLFGRLDGLLGSIDVHRGDFTKALDSVNRLTGVVNDERATIERGLIAAKPAVALLLEQRGSLRDLLGKVTTLSRTTRDVLANTEDKLVRQVRELGPVLDELAGVDGKLGDALSRMGPISDRFATAIPGDYLNMDGSIDVPGTVLSVLTGGAPPPGNPPISVGLQDFLGRGTR